MSASHATNLVSKEPATKLESYAEEGEPHGIKVSICRIKPYDDRLNKATNVPRLSWQRTDHYHPVALDKWMLNR